MTKISRSFAKKTATRIVKKVRKGSIDISNMVFVHNLSKGAELKNTMKIFMDYFGDDLFRMLTKRRSPKIVSKKAPKKNLMKSLKKKESKKKRT